MIFHYFTKKWKWFYGRYAPSGIRVWRKTMKNDEFEKRPLFWKNSSCDDKTIFQQKFLNGILRLILSRYDIEWVIYIIKLDIWYIKGPIKKNIRVNYIEFPIRIRCFLMKYAICFVGSQEQSIPDLDHPLLAAVMPKLLYTGQ